MPPPEPSVADALARQMTGQWQGLLQLMTQQGATRLDIMEMATATALLLLQTTGSALWPGPPPEGEAEHLHAFADVESALNDILKDIREDQPEDQPLKEET